MSRVYAKYVVNSVKKLMSMSSAGTIAGLSPWALLGVKGAGLGRRGGVPGAWPFMAAGAATAFRVKTGSSLQAC